MSEAGAVAPSPAGVVGDGGGGGRGRWRRSLAATRPLEGPEPMRCWPACFKPWGNTAERRWPTRHRSGRPRPGFLPCSLPRCGPPY